MPDAVDRIILVIGHLGEQIRAAVGTEALGRDVVYVEQAPLNGTGGAVLQSAGALRSDTFLVVNGDDIFCEPDLQALAAAGRSYLVQNLVFPRRMAACAFDREGVLTGFEMRDAKSLGTVICGAYCLGRDFLNSPPAPVPGIPGELSLPHTLVAMAGSYRAIPARLWLPCGSRDEIAYAERVVAGF
jgi:NDP-sugar pyrophosphorylase family protein